MLVRVKNTIINTDHITTIAIHEDEKSMATGKLSNYIMIYFSGDDKERVDFESKEELNLFLTQIKVTRW